MDTNNEIDAIIAEMEKEEKFDTIVSEITEPFEITEENVIEEEVIEDDVLVEDNPAVIIPKFEIGDAVKLVAGAKYLSGGEIPANLFNSKLYVRTIKNGNYGIAIKTSGRISGSVEGKYLTEYSAPKAEAAPEISYLVLVKAPELDIKSRPTENSKTLKTIHYNGLFTVIGEKDNWGHLKIGGWIPLDKVKKLGV